MKRTIQSVALMLALLLMSAPAWSFSYDDHVSQAPNGKGDVLVFPIYWSFGAFETKLQVINTSPNVSAIAKVVIRSPWHSEELLDFFIFLTPTDVWEGYLRIIDGVPTLYSEDDSILVNLTPTFASPDNPVVQPLLPSCDTATFGYAEVFLSYIFDQDIRNQANQITHQLTSPPVIKERLYDAFVGEGNLFENPVPRGGAVPAAFEPGYNILAGNQQIQNPVRNWTSALNATTLKDYRSTAVETLADETVFGARARNNILEVEAALSKNNIGMPYINNEEGVTYQWFNFPTKLTRTDECRIFAWLGRYDGFEGENPYVGGYYEFVTTTYTANVHDMRENQLLGEVPIFSPQPRIKNKFWLETDVVVPSAFSKGWARYNLPDGPTAGINIAREDLSYRGAPVIPVSMNIGPGGLSTMYGFWDDSVVLDGQLDPLIGYKTIRSYATSPDLNPS